MLKMTSYKLTIHKAQFVCFVVIVLIFNMYIFVNVASSTYSEYLLQIQGAIMVASLFQVVLGFSGLMGFVLRYIGPLTITPLVALTGLSLFEAGSTFAEKHWWIALL